MRPARDSWTIESHQPWHLWFNGSEKTLSPRTVAGLRLSWSIDGVNFSAPVAVGHTVLVTTSAGHLEARDALSGSVLWSVGDIAWLQGSADNNSPAVVSGAVIASGAGETLKAFELDSDRLLWSVPTVLPVAGPPVVAQETIYQATGGNGLFAGLTAYDAATGAVRWAREWTTTDWDYPLAGPTLLGSRMFVSDWLIGGVRAFDTAGGPLWETGSLSSGDFAMPAAVDKLVIYPGGSGSWRWPRRRARSSGGPPPVRSSARRLWRTASCTRATPTAATSRLTTCARVPCGGSPTPVWARAGRRQWPPTAWSGSPARKAIEPSGKSLVSLVGRAGEGGPRLADAAG
jgi:outer membrane protein assembly factor BamB